MIDNWVTLLLQLLPQQSWLDNARTNCRFIDRWILLAIITVFFVVLVQFLTALDHHKVIIRNVLFVDIEAGYHRSRCSEPTSLEPL